MPHNKVVQIATSYTGSVFALLADGSVWERVKTGNGAAGAPQWRWDSVPHPFEIASAGDAEIGSWR